MQQEYLTRAQVAAQYPISLSFLEKAKPEAGGPPLLRIGRKVLLKRSTFENWLDEHVADGARAPHPPTKQKNPRGRPTKAAQFARQGKR